jgi:hypothetical protein
MTLWLAPKTGKNRRELLANITALLGPLPAATFSKAKFFPVFNAEEPGQFSRSSFGCFDHKIADLRCSNLREHLRTQDMALVDFLDRCALPLLSFVCIVLTHALAIRNLCRFVCQIMGGLT